MFCRFGGRSGQQSPFASLAGGLFIAAGGSSPELGSTPGACRSDFLAVHDPTRKGGIGDHREVASVESTLLRCFGGLLGSLLCGLRLRRRSLLPSPHLPHSFGSGLSLFVREVGFLPYWCRSSSGTGGSSLGRPPKNPDARCASNIGANGPIRNSWPS